MTSPPTSRWQAIQELDVALASLWSYGDIRFKARSAEALKAGGDAIALLAELADAVAAVGATTNPDDCFAAIRHLETVLARVRDGANGEPRQ